MKKLLLLAVTVLVFISCSSGDDATKQDDIAIISTEFGEMHVLLYDQTPIHKDNFIKLANEGFYDSTTFHRVIQGFMIQGGDPNSKDDNPMNDGQGGPGYTLEAEFDNQLVHKKERLQRHAWVINKIRSEEAVVLSFILCMADRYKV